MSEEKQEIKVAPVLVYEVDVKCPNCGRWQYIKYKPGYNKICQYCDKYFQIGEIK